MHWSGRRSPQTFLPCTWQQKSCWALAGSGRAPAPTRAMPASADAIPLTSFGNAILIPVARYSGAVVFEIGTPGEIAHQVVEGGDGDDRDAVVALHFLHRRELALAAFH